MRKLERLATMGTILVTMLATTAAPVGAAGTTTRYVDSDGHASTGNCNGSGHAFKHIQAAVNASGHNDTVIVCPGTYVEQVAIDGDRDGLTLRSSEPFGATIKSPSSLDAFQTATYIVLVSRVDDVTIQGFKVIVRTAAPCDSVTATLLIIGSRRVTVRGNRLLAPGSGSGACFQLNGFAMQDTLDGIRARSSSARVSSNEIRDAVQGSVLAAGFLRHVSLDVIGNSIRAYFGQVPTGAASAASSPARLGGAPQGAAAAPTGGLAAGYYAVGLGGLISGSIRANVIQGATAGPANGPFFYYGIFIVASNGGVSGPYLNGPVDVRDNLIRRTMWGMFVVVPDELTVRDNTFTNVGTGLAANGIKDSTVRGNTITAKESGIALDATSVSNTLKGNTVAGNGGTCDDASSGGGTASTANTWTGNTATVGDSPNGICPTP